MAHGLTESDTFDATVTVPDDGDTSNVNSVNTAFQALANRTNYLRNRLFGGGSPVNVPLAFIENASSRFIFRQGKWSQGDVTDGGGLWLPLPFTGGSCTGVIVSVNGDWLSAGTHAGLPATMPAVELFKSDGTASALPTSLGSQSDTSGSVGAYEATHDIELTISAESITDDVALWVKVTGEASTNALAGRLGVLGLKAKVS